MQKDNFKEALEDLNVLASKLLVEGQSARDIALSVRINKLIKECKSLAFQRTVEYKEKYGL